MIAMMKLSLYNRGKGSKRGTSHDCQRSITILKYKECTSTFEVENCNKRTFANVFLHDHKHQEVVHQQINQDQIVVSPCRRRKFATLCTRARNEYIMIPALSTPSPFQPAARAHTHIHSHQAWLPRASPKGAQKSLKMKKTHPVRSQTAPCPARRS